MANPTGPVITLHGPTTHPQTVVWRLSSSFEDNCGECFSCIIIMTAFVMSVLLIWWFDVTTLHCISCMRILLVVLHYWTVWLVVLTSVAWCTHVHCISCMRMWSAFLSFMMMRKDEKREKREKKKIMRKELGLKRRERAVEGGNNNKKKKKRKESEHIA